MLPFIASLIFLGGTTKVAPAPLDPLSALEINAARDAIRRSGQFSDSVLYPYVGLAEPPKGAELSRARWARVHLYEPATNLTTVVVLNLATGALVSRTPVAGDQPNIMYRDTNIASEVVRRDPIWQAAMRKRGFTRFDDFHLEIWAPGYIPNVENRRMVRVLTFLGENSPNQNARPIEGVVALVDVNAGKVVSVSDTGVRPVPPEIGEFPTPTRASRRAAESDDIAIDGYSVRWDRWTLRIGFDARTGVTLHKIAFDGRSIVYRASLSEMSVPYGDPDENWSWRSAFDAGEYGLGICTTPLEIGSDVPDDTRCLDVSVALENGMARRIERGIGVYERDGGLLWRHNHGNTGITASRRGRELVVTSIPTIGNYDYQVSYVFRQDGSMAVETNLTGIMLAKGTARTAETGGHDSAATSHLVAPNVAAVNHQHFFNFRLDLDIDGATNNRFLQCDTVPVPSDSGNAFAMQEKRFATEGFADPNRATSRNWRIVNPGKPNRLGIPVGYTLLQGENAPPLTGPTSDARREAGFTEHAVWVTKFQPDQLYGAGDFPSQAENPTGLHHYVNGEPIDGEDLVVWYTLGITHIPRPEDWPVMPVHRASLNLIPTGFFNQNPVLK